MKKTVFLMCGKAFDKYDDAVRFLCANYTVLTGNRRFESGLRRIADGEYSSVPKRLNLPASVSLASGVRLVRNQASRGTCAAHAGVALMEYYEGGKFDLSVQYLYERMKRLERDAYRTAAKEVAEGREISNPLIKNNANAIVDEYARNNKVTSVSTKEIAHLLYNKCVEMDGGSWAEFVFQALEEYGVCREGFWPYAREQLDTRELVTDYNNREIPPCADEDAKRHRLNDKHYIFTSPNNVEEIKKYLAGDNLHAPMPVYIGALLFADEKGHLPEENGFAKMPRIIQVAIQKGIIDVDSTTSSKHTFDAANIDPDTVKDVESLDVLDMKMSGGHAMLIVGYEDDESVAGGGYFTVLNSWGEDWGENGYVKLPYAYVELFVNSAGTILVPPDAVKSQASNAEDIPEDIKPYIMTADRDMKNSRGIWQIEKGKRVIVDEDGAAELDTPLNRKRFAERGYSWSGAVQSKSDDGCTVKSAAVTGRSQERGRFISGIESAFKRMPVEFPLLGGVDKAGLFSSPAKAHEFKKVADLSSQFGDTLIIYDVRGKKKHFLLAVVWLSSSACAGDKAELARQLISDYSASKKFDPCDCSITVVASSEAIGDLVQPYMSDSDVRLIADRYVTDAGWRISVSDKGGDSYWHEWLKRLVPNMPSQWTTQLLAAWQDLSDIGGHITLARMAERLDIPQSEVVALVCDFMKGFKVKGDRVVKE